MSKLSPTSKNNTTVKANVKIINGFKTLDDVKQWGLTLTQQDLENLIIYTKDKYYNDEQVISDIEWDELYDILKSKYPKSSIISNVGAPIRDEINKIKLPYWMGSMNKIKPLSRELTKWLDTYKGAYLISEKLDGISALLVRKNSSISLYTRGDGEYGQNLDYLVKSLNLPFKKEDKDIDIAIRGEFMIEKTLFETKYSKTYPKARSLVSGIINSKHPDPNIIKDIEFIAYEIILPDKLKASKQFKMLEDLEFKTAHHIEVEIGGLNNDTLVSLYDKFKKSSKYEIDGIIITQDDAYKRNTSGNPAYSVAFKMQLDEQMALTTVEKVEWNVSKHGALKPRVKFNPVVIGGDTITYATGFNARYIVDNKIGIGAKIKIIRSGDVIPYIDEIITGAKTVDMPPKDIKYHWNTTNIDIYLDDVSSNVDVITKSLVNFFKQIEVPFLGSGIITKLIEGGLNTISSIYGATERDLNKLEGFQSRMASKIYKAIHDVLDSEIPLHTLMSASNVFGVGFGERKLLPLITMYPDILTRPKTFTREEIMNVEGFSTKTATIFLANLSLFKDFLSENPFLKYRLNRVETTIDNTMENKNSIKPLEEFIIVMTGFRNSELEKKINILGGTVAPGISSKTSILIAKDPMEKSSKINKAREFGTTIMSLDEFEKKYINSNV
jgi:NAD-dependent DNA ligase